MPDVEYQTKQPPINMKPKSSHILTLLLYLVRGKYIAYVSRIRRCQMFDSAANIVCTRVVSKKRRKNEIKKSG